MTEKERKEQILASEVQSNVEPLIKIQNDKEIERLRRMLEDFTKQMQDFINQ